MMLRTRGSFLFSVTRRRLATSGGGLWEEEVPAAREVFELVEVPLELVTEEESARALRDKLKELEGSRFDFKSVTAAMKAAVEARKDEHIEVLQTIAPQSTILRAAMHAAAKARLSQLKMLLPHVNDVEAYLGNDTLVRCAVKSGEPRVLDEVLNAGADVHASNPYATAMIHRQFKKMLPYLKQLGVRDTSPLGVAMENNDLEGAKRAIESTKYPRRKQGMSRQVMAYACRQNSLEWAKFALPLIPEVSIIDVSRAARYNATNVLPMLLKRVDITKAPLDRSGPVYPAVLHRHHECVEMLLEAGMDVSRDVEGHLLTQARVNNDAKMLAILEKAGAKVRRPTLEAMVRMNDLNSFSELLDTGGHAEADLRGALILAIVKSRPDMVHLLLQKHPDLSKAEDASGTPVLVRAARSNQTGIVRHLLHAGADPNKGDPMRLARIQKNRDMFTLLERAGARNMSRVAVAVRDLNYDFLATLDPEHVMKVAVSESAIPVVEWLLDRGDVGARSVIEWSLLNQNEMCALSAFRYVEDNETLKSSREGHSSMLAMAARGGFLEAARELLKRGVDANERSASARSKALESPLALAKKGRHNHVCELLLRYGAEPDNPMENAIHSGEVDLARKLLKKESANGNVALSSCVRANEIPMLRELVEESNERGAAAMVLAAIHNRPEVVRTLVDMDLTLRDAKGHQGDTALMIACKHGHYETVKVLLELGADPNIGDPVRLMRHRGDPAMCKLLVEYGAENSDPVVSAVEDNNLEDLKVSLDSKGPEHRGLFLKRALKMAARRQRVEMSRWLLENGADGHEAIYTTAVHNNVPVARLILDMCPYVDIDMPSRTRCESLALFAVRKSHQEYLRFLHQRGADLDLSNPLHIARIRKQRVMVDILERYGVHAMDNVVLNAWKHHDMEAVKAGVDTHSMPEMRHNLRMAAQRGNLEMVAWLLGNGARPEWGINSAIASGEIEALLKLLEAAPDYEATVAKEPVLHSVARQDNVSHVLMLIDRGLNHDESALDELLKRNGQHRMRNAISDWKAQAKD